MNYILFCRIKSTYFLLFFSLILLGCSTPVTEKMYVIEWQEGDFRSAKKTLNADIALEMPNENFRLSDDAVLLFLERATVSFAEGDTNKAIEDYRRALEALDFYCQSDTVEDIEQALISDTSTAYSGADYEQILARIYLALSLLQSGDEQNAHALLRQAESVQQEKRECYGNSKVTQDFHLADNAVAKYLLGCLEEKSGDRSNARILYKQTEELVESDQIKRDLARIECTNEAEKSSVIIVCHNGKSPYKVSSIADASIASQAAIEAAIALSGGEFAISGAPGIPVPLLVEYYDCNPVETEITIDGLKKNTERWYNIAAAANLTLEQELPVIVARGVLRHAARRIAVAVAQESSPVVGLFTDLAMTIMNECTKADTRSWTTLPKQIELARFDLDSGEHEVVINTNPLEGTAQETHYQVELKQGDLCVINVFNIGSDISIRQIPKKFIVKEGKIL